jgi:hypothetical protein
MMPASSPLMRLVQARAESSHDTVPLHNLLPSMPTTPL